MNSVSHVTSAFCHFSFYNLVKWNDHTAICLIVYKSNISCISHIIQLLRMIVQSLAADLTSVFPLRMPVSGIE